MLNQSYDEILLKTYGLNYQNEVLPPLLVLDSLNIIKDSKKKFITH